MTTPTANPQPSSDPKAKKSLTEAEAKAKIADLRKKLLSGADFGQVARENSDDKESAAKDGDFPPIKRSSSYPEDIKNAVFALKPGEISAPTLSNVCVNCGPMAHTPWLPCTSIARTRQ